MSDIFGASQTLIVVYKDELVLNLLKKLIETNDDKSEDEIVGTEDGTVSVVSWDERMWLEQKKAGNIDSKILFIGPVKGTDKLYPILDIKYDKWGIKYGWAGNQAMISVDGHYVSKRAHYNAFLKEFRANNLPEKKAESTPKTILKFGGLGFAFGLMGFGAIGIGAMALGDYYFDKQKVRQQLYLFGILKMYKNHLDEFMKS